MSYGTTIGSLSDCKRPMKTPVIKTFASAMSSNSFEVCNQVQSTPAIIMDEYGQTPDHYYLASNPPKPPTCLTQVKRKLDLESSKSSNSDPLRGKRGKFTHMDFSAQTVKSSMEKQRYDTSLGQLTKKFLELLTDSSDGVVNLNRACTLLSVPKRRIYDITNVLEGAGLLEKKSRNNIQWKGGSAHALEDLVKYELQLENDVLESKENQLDELIHNTRYSIASMKEADKKYAFVTNQDIQNIQSFNDQTLIGIKASPETLLEAHENFKIRLKSKDSEIAAYLFTDEPAFKALENRKVNEQVKIKIENRKISASNDKEREQINCLTDPVLKYALITEDDDLAPMGKNFLLQTEDQHCDPLPFVHLEPPISEEDYCFTLDEGEGITDLFDTCEFSCS